MVMVGKKPQRIICQHPGQWAGQPVTGQGQETGPWTTKTQHRDGTLINNILITFVPALSSTTIIYWEPACWLGRGGRGVMPLFIFLPAQPMVRHFNYFLKTVQIIIIIIVKLGSRPCPGQLRCLTGQSYYHLHNQLSYFDLMTFKLFSLLHYQISLKTKKTDITA